MKKITLLTSVLALALFASACNTSSDPLKGYKDLSKSVPPSEADRLRDENAKKNLDPIIKEEHVVVPPKTPQPQPTPIVKEEPKKDLRAVFHVTPDSDLSFIEGEQGQVNLKVRFDFPGIEKFSIQKIDGPESMTLKDVSTAETPNTWAVIWTPEFGTVKKGAFEYNQKIKVRMVADKIADKQVAQVWPMINKDQDFDLTVRRTDKSLTLNADDLRKKQLVEGQLIPFSIDVDDPLSYAGYEPSVDPFSSEVGKIETVCESNGAIYVRADKSKKSPESLGGHKWRFYFIFDSRQLAAQLDAKCDKVIDSDILNIRLSFKAKSHQSEATSAEELVQTKVAYNYQAQDIIFLMGERSKPITVDAGTEVKLNLLAYVGDLKGQITIADPKVGETMPGNPSFICQEGGDVKSQMDCALQWKVPCTGVKPSYTFEVQGTHMMADKTKTSSFKKEIKVNLKSSACQATTQGVAQ
jgi:hypothetical protein